MRRDYTLSELKEIPLWVSLGDDRNEHTRHVYQAEVRDGVNLDVRMVGTESQINSAEFVISEVSHSWYRNYNTNVWARNFMPYQSLIERKLKRLNSILNQCKNFIGREELATILVELEV